MVSETRMRGLPFPISNIVGAFGGTKILDALMRLGDTPYVVELKETSGSRLGQYYRHAITQAVLYREFVRRAEKIHSWFINKKLDPYKTRAVVAFQNCPKMIIKRKGF